MLFNSANSIQNRSLYELQKVWYQSLEQDRQQRLYRYLHYWNFYRNNHWENSGSDNEGLVTVNYCKKAITKSNDWLFGKGIEFTAKEGFDEVIPFINNVWDNNKGQKKMKLLYNTGIMGGITGDMWVKVIWDKEKSPDNPIRLILLDSSIVEPVFNIHDLDDIQAVTISYPFWDEEAGKVVHYWEEVSNDRIIIKHDDTIIFNDVNPYGFINIVHGQNQPVPSDFWGESDLTDIIPINKQFNEKNTDVSDIIKYHAEPITCIFGAKMRNIVQGDDKTWSGFPDNARVENIQLNGDLGASNDHIANIKSYFHEISGIPRGSLDTMGGISNTTGVGLGVQFLPLIELTLRKQITYGEFIKEINGLIIRIAEKMNYGGINWSKFKSDKYSCIDCVFEMPLPKDKLIELNIIREEMALGLESRRGAMERLKKRDINKKLKEIDEERSSDELGIFSSLKGINGNVNNAKNIGGVLQKGETVDSVKHE